MRGPGSRFRKLGPELFFAIVAPVGTDSAGVCAGLRTALMSVGYQSKVLHLIEKVHEFNLDSREHHEANYYEQFDSHMTLGNDFRRQTDSDDAFSLLAAALVLAERRRSVGTMDLPALTTRGVRKRYAWIFRSLKRHEEVRTLRDIYGEDGVFVVAAHASREARIARLAQQIATTDFLGPPSRYRDLAEKLVQRDEYEIDETHGQRLRETFPLADVSIDASEPSQMTAALARFISLLFDRGVITPDRGEYAMAHAQAAALRSASLGRQVGAAISTDDGEVVAVGTNEVPKAGGGLYWGDDTPDRRDFRLGFDPGTDTKKRGLGQIMKRLYEESRAAKLEGGEAWLSDETMARIEAGGLHGLVEKAWNLSRGSELVDVLEFGRTVHAEMAALMDAARRGVSVRGCTLFTTTFPCHMCARHIVAAGIRQVVYREPYPKSLAMELHFDAVQLEPKEVSEGQVGFLPFMGVPPRRYIDLFTMGARLNGRPRLRSPSESEPRLWGFPPSAYVAHEIAAAALLRDRAGRSGAESSWLSEMLETSRTS